MNQLSAFRLCWLFTLAIVTWTFEASVWAQEITSRLEVPGIAGSTVYTNVRVMGMTERGVKISHDSGISVLPVANLPKEWLLKFAPAQPSKAEEAKPVEVIPNAMATGIAASSTSNIKSFDPNCLVIIKTDSGTGSGFIAKVGKVTYVYTNAHVLCGGAGGFTSKITSIKTATDRTIPIPYELELSETFDPEAPHGLEDVARFPVTLKGGENSYEIATLDAKTSMDQEVVAYGNSLGGDVITSLEGKILGLGTDRIEISCEIVPGNSGGPVLLTDTKQVIGISTYVDASGKRDIWAKGTTFDKVRRFAVRPDKVTKWRKLLYTSLISSLAELNDFERDTLSLAAACYLNPKANRGGFDVPSHKKGDYVIKEVIVSGSSSTLGATISGGIAKVNQRLGSATSTLSMTAAVPVFTDFFSSVAKASASQAESLKTSDRAPYLKQFFPALIQERGEVHAAFVKEGASRYR